MARPFVLARQPNPTGAPLRNREPATAPGTWTSLLDESLEIVAGSALDLSSMRTTAVPAGSKGRITASGRKLQENGVEVRFNVASWTPDSLFAPIPSDRALVARAAANLAKQGYNAIRLHGLENWLMAGVTGAATFDAARLDLLDYFLSQLKVNGVYWVLSIASYNLFLDMAGATNRFTFTEASSCKPRIYTELNIRQNWRAGVQLYLDHVNPYTGVALKNDPALLAISVYNEQSTTFCATKVFPTVWLTRTGGSAAAAKIWVEWLSDSAQSHGYADLAALNTAWSSAHASFAAAAAVTVPPFTNTTYPATRQAIDALKYAMYLEDDLAAFYQAQIDAIGYTGLTFWSEIYSGLLEGRAYGKYSINKIYAPHSYPSVVSAGTLDGSTLKAGTNAAVWDYENAALTPADFCNSKPFACAEFGFPAWMKYRAQFPVIAAIQRTHDCAYATHYGQGDIFTLTYGNDATSHGYRTRRIEPYADRCDPIHDFIRVALAAMFMRGDVSEMDVTKRLSLPLNERYSGTNPVNTSRVQRALYSAVQPLALVAAIRRFGLDWTDDTSSDNVAVWSAKSFKTLIDEAVTDGAISVGHPTEASVTINSGIIASVALTGAVGGLTATATAPVFEFTGNTLLVGDRFVIGNLTGSGGTWPGVNNRNAVVAVTAKGTGAYVQASVNLSAASGTMTAGTWAEVGNNLVAGNQQWGMSRRLKHAWVNTPRFAYYSHAGATLPVTLGSVRIDALTTDCALLVASLDGLDISASRKLLLGTAGDSQNTGMAFTDGTRMTIAAGGGGDYPVQPQDATAQLSLTLPRPTEWVLYRLQRDGQRVSAESPRSVDATAGQLVVTLRTGTVQPSGLWELVRP